MLTMEPNILIKFEEKTLTFHREPNSINEVKAIAESLDKTAPDYSFWVGDLLNYAEKHYERAWIDVIPPGTARKTANNLKWVCRKVPPEQRCFPLPFGFYSAVAGKSEEEKRILLEMVIEEGWSLKKLQWEMKSRDAREEKSKIVCPQCGYDWLKEMGT